VSGVSKTTGRCVFANIEKTSVARSGDNLSLPGQIQKIYSLSNASISLPEIIINPDWDFLFLSMVIVSILCGLMFALGFYISKIYSLARAEKISMMFALGMNNNGSGLVLASMALSDHPRVMLPLIIYTLIQHLFAAYVDRILSTHD